MIRKGYMFKFEDIILNRIHKVYVYRDEQSDEVDNRLASTDELISIVPISVEYGTPLDEQGCESLVKIIEKNREIQHTKLIVEKMSRELTTVKRELKTLKKGERKYGQT